MTRSARRRGFTTIELMIALIIVAVLIVLAYPIFMDQIRKSRRADGIAALANLQQAQERWRSTNAAYAPNGELTTGLRLQPRSTYYNVGISSATAVGYVASASAVAGTSQAADTPCTALWVRMQEGNLAYGSGASPDWTDANRCWAR